MGNIEKALSETLEKETSKIKDGEGLKRFIEADKKFQELVERGITSKRGYNLLSFDDAHLKRSLFNR